MKTPTINIISISYLIILAGLSLLFFPLEAFVTLKTTGYLLCPLLMLSILAWKKRVLFVQNLSLLSSLFLLFLAFFHGQALQLWQQAENNLAHPFATTTAFSIEKIYRQQAYQTVLAKIHAPSPYQKQRVYLNWPGKERPKSGEIWYGTLKLHPLASRLNFGGFNRQQWYFSQGITAYGSVKGAKKIENAQAWRDKALEKAYGQTENLPMQGLLLALGFGERAWLSKAQMQIYQQTNTAHLIAISGLHIGLAFLLGFYLARIGQYFLPQRWIFPQIPWLVGLAVAFFYALLAGFAIPTFRAIVALSVITLLQLQRLHLTKWQYFPLVMAILLLCDPFMLLSSSFWLSVGAVFSLMLWYEFVPLSFFQWRGQPFVQSTLKNGQWLISLVHLQIGLLWLFTPIQLAIFHGFSLFSLMCNLVAVPLYSFLVVPCVLGATLFSIDSLWLLANSLVLWTETGLSLFQEGWFTFSFHFKWSIASFCILSFLIFLLYLKRIKKAYSHRKKEQRLAKMAVTAVGKKAWPININPEALPSLKVIKRGILLTSFLLLVQIGVAIQNEMAQKDWRLTMLDVGQGLAVLVEKNQRGVLYDTGIRWGKGQGAGSMAQVEILPYLMRNGIELDQVIASHDDLDHVGGVADMLHTFPQAVYTSPSFKNYYALQATNFRRECIKGKKWRWQGLDFSVLWPKKRVAKAKNEDSCVLLISDGTHRVLLMGDADKKVERQILAQLPKIDVLQVGHHGSNTSSDPLFLQKISPKLALVSASRWNMWGLPRKEVRERFKEYAIPLLNTAEQGAIQVDFAQNDWRYLTARHAFSPWYSAFVGDEVQINVQ